MCVFIFGDHEFIVASEIYQKQFLLISEGCLLPPTEAITYSMYWDVLKYGIDICIRLFHLSQIQLPDVCKSFGITGT